MNNFCLARRQSFVAANVVDDVFLIKEDGQFHHQQILMLGFPIFGATCCYEGKATIIIQPGVLHNYRSSACYKRIGIKEHWHNFLLLRGLRYNTTSPLTEGKKCNLGF
jgi:hypothetical protein